ncbi:MAG: hypothetical protein KatS3mg102_2779 [Planctomycetota bacterium]|nr:MAG: hypothetical protein KatS3mg102_2779 [Planctomycetota bacterium]
MKRSFCTAVGLAGMVVALACGGGCGDGQGGQRKAGGGASSGASGGGAAAAQPPAGEWLRGDLHVHTHYSHDADRFGDTVEASIRLAEHAGLDFVVLGDHRVVDVLADPQLTATPTHLVVIPGMEWGGAGHAGAHNLSHQPPYVSQSGAADPLRAIQDTIASVHAQGGFFVLNHPMDPKNPWLWPAHGYDGIEIWNQLWAMRRVAEITVADMQDWARRHGNLPLPPEALLAAGARGGGSNHQALKRWEALLEQGHKLAAVGGGDRHYAVLPGEPVTLVFARERTRAAIAEGVRQGRTMVARAVNAARVEFAADADGDGVFESIIGDRVPLGRSIQFRVRVVDGEGGMFALIRNGQELVRQPITAPDETFTFGDTPAVRSWYRVDVWEPLELSDSKARMLRSLVLGTAGQNGLLSGGLASLLSSWFGSWLQDLQDIVASGVPAAVWLLIHGQDLGVQVAPVPSRYPVIQWPERVSRILNTDPLAPEYCRAVITSPIWAE